MEYNKFIIGRQLDIQFDTIAILHRFSKSLHGVLWDIFVVEQASVRYIFFRIRF